MTLPYDSPRCLHDTPPCPHGAVCLRRSPGREGYQAYTAYPGGEDCPGLIADRKDEVPA